MGQCFGKNNTQSANGAAQKSHNKQIELHLQKDQEFKKRVFFTGNHECIANIFYTIDGNKSIQIQNSSKLLVCGYIRKYSFCTQIPFDIHLLLNEFYGKTIQFPNHYEFYPKLTITPITTHCPPYQSTQYESTPFESTPYPIPIKTTKMRVTTPGIKSPTISSTITTIDGDISFPNHLQYPIEEPIPSDTDKAEEEEFDAEKDIVDKHIEYQLSFPDIVSKKKSETSQQETSQQGTSQLMITYHNLQCFKKKDYYLKWIHLLDNSLSVIFVADLSLIGVDIDIVNRNIEHDLDDKLLLKDMERFRRLMFYSNGKYDSRMPILVLSGIDKFNCHLSKQEYRQRFESQFPSFEFIQEIDNEFDVEYNTTYYQQALKHIKNQYLMIFENNLRNGSYHWSNRRYPQSQKLFIRTINDVNDINEVRKVWIKLNKALVHGNIMHELRNGGIAV